MAALRFIHDPPGTPRVRRGYLILEGWPHYAHGGSVLGRPCNDADDLRREVQTLKRQLEAALAEGEEFFRQLK